MSDVISRYTRILGDEIRRRRQAVGWTRLQLLDHLPVDISLQTLATYELGTRRLAADRLDEIARALGTHAHLILADVDERAYIKPGGYRINLGDLANTRRLDLSPARRWAAIQAELVGGTELELTTHALDALAGLCNLDRASLLDALDELHADA